MSIDKDTLIASLMRKLENIQPGSGKSIFDEIKYWNYISEDEYNNIVLLRAQNLLKGKQKGGQNYALNNTFQKDEHGKFTGSTRNGRQI